MNLVDRNANPGRFLVLVKNSSGNSWVQVSNPFLDYEAADLHLRETHMKGQGVTEGMVVECCSHFKNVVRSVRLVRE